MVCKESGRPSFQYPCCGDGQTFHYKVVFALVLSRRATSCLQALLLIWYHVGLSLLEAKVERG